MSPELVTKIKHVENYLFAASRMAVNAHYSFSYLQAAGVLVCERLIRTEGVL